MAQISLLQELILAIGPSPLPKIKLPLFKKRQSTEEHDSGEDEANYVSGSKNNKSGDILNLSMDGD